MAFPTNMPSFTVREPKLAVVYLGSTTAGATTWETIALGQIRSINPQVSATKEETVYRRLGDAKAHTYFGSTAYAYPVTMNFLHGKSLKELAQTLGVDTAIAGSWDGVEVNAELKKDVKIEIWSDATTGAVKETEWIVHQFGAMTLNPTFDAESGAPIIEVTGEAENVTFNFGLDDAGRP